MLWVADMTYVSTWAGFIYLAEVIDGKPPAIPPSPSRLAR